MTELRYNDDGLAEKRVAEALKALDTGFEYYLKRRVELVEHFARLGYRRPRSTAAAILRNEQDAQIARFVAPHIRAVLEGE